MLQFVVCWGLTPTGTMASDGVPAEGAAERVDAYIALPSTSGIETAPAAATAVAAAAAAASRGAAVTKRHREDRNDRRYRGILEKNGSGPKEDCQGRFGIGVNGNTFDY